jgi:Tetracyclin repressor-like, C-terminal domain
MNENIERGAYLAQSKIIQELNVPAIAAIRRMYERGVKQGVFRAGLDPVDIHASISALSFFNVSNKHTFGLIFKESGRRAEAATRRRANVTEMVLRFVKQAV